MKLLSNLAIENRVPTQPAAKIAVRSLSEIKVPALFWLVITIFPMFMHTQVQLMRELLIQRGKLYQGLVI